MAEIKTRVLRGRYRQLEVVGRGGEGEVVRALDQQHGRQVALKIRTVGDESSRQDLLSEARLLLSLSPHPGLPLVREDFFVDDRYVIAMDWIDGTDLQALLEREGTPGLEPPLASAYIEQAAEALEHLHTHDPPVVHGDVKPANLILTSSGRIVLVDFGLSSTPADELRRAGTAGYVAPEVAAGARPTAASDVYSLTATALTLLTGDSPSGSAPSWEGLERERVPALERILRRNLATDPARRDASATAFAARLRRWWGADLPTGAVTLLQADLGAMPLEDAEDAVDDIARARRGHCVAPAGGPLLAAFASAEDAVDAARELASRSEARLAAATGEAEPRGGSYRGQLAADAAALLAAAEPGEVRLDDATAQAVDGRLPPDVALAEVREAAAPTSWALVAPGLRFPRRAAACPYRGLMAFRAEDDDLFFGREEVVASLVDRLLETGFIAVVGASGSGKSSLVRAGLVPAYRRARRGRVVVLTPGSDPVAELRRSLAAGAPTLLVVDQLEEAFALCPDEASRERFFDQLLDLRGSTAVVVALRADFYGRCAEHARLAGAVAADQHLLGPMSTDELRRAIEGPARAGGLRLEAGLVDTMLADVDGEPGALPLLSHALYESWVRRDGRVLTRAGYLEAGGVRGAIARTAEQVFVDCTPSEQLLVRELCLALTELGETTEDTRRRVPLAELLPPGEGHEEARAVLERLAGARLLVVDDGSVEIAHEALIREWPRLRGWLAEDREQLRALRQLSASARAWLETGGDPAHLYRGTRLAAALELSGSERQLSRVEGEFLQASRDAQEHELKAAQRRARRLRILVAVIAAALVLALVAGSFALLERGSARHSATVAQAGRLAAQSRELAPQHPDLGLLLALEAGRFDDSVDTRGALLGALEHASRIRAWLQGFASPVNASAFSPDGKLLATTTFDGTTLWNTRTWKRVGEPLRSSQGRWEGLDWSPDGRTLAIAGGEGRVELWDVSTRKELREFEDPAAASADDPALATVRFSPDGSILAAGGQEANHVTVWNAATGRVLGRPMAVKPPGSGGAQSISFSPDSRRIAVPGSAGKVGIWAVATGRKVRRLAIGNAGVGSVIFARGGRAIIATDDSGRVSFVDVRTGRPWRDPLSVGDNGADSLDLSPDGRLLAVASYDGPVFVWDVKTGTPYGAPLAADTSPPNGVTFSPDGRTLVTGHLDSAVVWDLSGRHVLGTRLGRQRDVVSDVAFSSDGRWLVAGLLGGDTVVYDAATRKVARRLRGTSPVTAVAVRPDGARVAVGTVDGHVRLFDPQTGAVVGSPLGVGRLPVWQLAFSPNGRLLAVDTDPNGAGKTAFTQPRSGRVQLWNVDSRRRVGRAIVPHAGTVFSVAFNPAGTLLATGSYFGRLDLWDVSTQAHHGKRMKVADDGVASVAFDPKGQLFAMGGANGPVRVWRVSDQRPALPALTGQTPPVTGASFAPAGSMLATTSLFGGTRLWDSATGLGYGGDLVSERPASREPHVELPFLGVGNAFSRDGKLLAAAGVDAYAMLWEVDPAVWRERACAIVGRNLNREEWKTYLPAGTPYRATCSEWPAR